MKRTFLPIVILLTVTLTLVAWLYFTDVNGDSCEENPPAKKVKTGFIYSSLELVDAANSSNLAVARIII